MLARHCFNVTVETGLDHWPNIYCGVAVFALLPLYTLQRKIPLRQKVPKLLLLVFILISFSTNVLNFIWHGLNYPDSLPARQSFLYILLLLTLCHEAFLHIQEYSKNMLCAVFAGVLFFLLLCEKIVTDDAFTSTCFLVTGIFLLIYAGLIFYYRIYGKDFDKNSTVFRLMYLCAVLATVAESGVNTYLTSVPTVSRTTYLSNYDSYQTLTDRTVQNEGNDFFRFEKFARRTQNDAMLIGFQGCSYFSSTLNSLVSDFYEKYGMRGSRVNYCFEGATPVTAALLSTRYMLYTLDRGYDNLFDLVDSEGKLYLYKNNYSLPLGYMITSPDALFNDDGENEDKNLNPIQRQNKLAHRLGVSDDVFISVAVNSYGNQADIYIGEDAHYYAYTPNTKIDTIKMDYGEAESKSFSQIKKKYILDLGYHETGDTLSLKSENGESLKLTAYKVNEPALARFVNLLSQDTLTVDNYDETSLNGHITVSSAGHLALSIPYDPGWTLYVDGVRTEMDLFEDTFISVPSSRGTHTVTLNYFPQGFVWGIIVSIICILLFAAIYYISRSYQK